MLYVSLGYSSLSDEPNAQKINVQRSLQIDGKPAVTIGHHFLLPFRRDPLLLSRTKAIPHSDQSFSLPLNETCILVVSARNCTEVPLQLLSSMSIETDNDGIEEKSCSIKSASDNLVDPALLMPGEEFKKVFTVTSEINPPKLRVGNVLGGKDILKKGS